MRQVLEAFSTFEYKKGIEEVSTNTKILNILKEPGIDGVWILSIVQLSSDGELK